MKKMFKFINVPVELRGTKITEDSMNNTAFQKLLDEQRNKGYMFFGFVGEEILFRIT